MRVPNIMAGLAAMADGPRPIQNRAAHFYDEQVSLYARFGLRIAPPTRVRGWFFTLATFDVHKEEHQNKGLFKEIVLGAEFLAAQRPDVLGIYVESLNFVEAIPMMRRFGYKPRPDANPYGTGYGADWFKIINPQASQEPPDRDDTRLDGRPQPGQFYWVELVRGIPEIVRVEEAQTPETRDGFVYTRIGSAHVASMNFREVRFLEPVVPPVIHLLEEAGNA